ncbi:MAG: hypothetical protein BWK76_09490 [Desulfobulbaceae bacterium A2]|nr:MAG: hypothetical protein BWK76_09490 [Desulfobulbaceae bacterium A2]
MHSISLALTLCSCLLLTACAGTGDLGRLERDQQVASTFETLTVLPGHRYYAFGPEAEPDAVVAIEESLTWSSRYWNAIEPTPRFLADWQRQLASNPLRQRTPPFGAVILAPDGRRVGAWYGWPEFVVVQFPAENQILIYPPEPTHLQRMTIFEGGESAQ